MIQTDPATTRLLDPMPPRPDCTRTSYFLTLWARTLHGRVVVELPEESCLTLGRYDYETVTETNVDLTEFNALLLGVSRQHARIDCGGSVPALCDLNSANGTCLNGQRLTPGAKYLLHDGDVICLGKLVLYVDML